MEVTVESAPGTVVTTESLGQALRARREALGLSRFALARESRLKSDNIKALEEGATGVRWATIRSLCETMNLKVVLTPAVQDPMLAGR